MEVIPAICEITEVVPSAEIMAGGVTGLKSLRVFIIKGRAASSVKGAAQISTTSQTAVLSLSVGVGPLGLVAIHWSGDQGRGTANGGRRTL